MSALADAQIEAQRRLRARIVAAFAGAWGRMPGYDEADVPAWLAFAVPASLAAQRQSLAVTNAMLARAAGRAPLPLDTAGVLAGLRGGADPREVQRRPFVTVWTALKAGDAYSDAVAAGLARAQAGAAADVALAQRATMQAVQDADPGIRGWQRAADPGACEYCQAIDGAFVRRADASPLHPHCGCTLEPIFEPVAESPLPEGVAVSRHGELGPVIGDAEHSFARL